MLIPTLSDPTMAPPGKHFMSCVRAVCATQGRRRQGVDRRETATRSARPCIEPDRPTTAPGFMNLDQTRRDPHPRARLENEVGLTEGNIFQGELTMDQLLFNRPIPGLRAIPRPGEGPVDVWFVQRTRAAASWPPRAPTRRAKSCWI